MQSTTTNQSGSTRQATPAPDPVAMQHLTFHVNDHEYGVQILSVLEIRRWEPCTWLPNSPDHVLGVVNLRGSILPLIDLRRLLDMPPREPDWKTAIVVVELGEDNGREKAVGLVVDGVSDVCAIDSSLVRPPPALASGAGIGLIQGIVTLEGRMIVLLDLSPLRAAREAHR